MSGWEAAGFLLSLAAFLLLQRAFHFQIQRLLQVLLPWPSLMMAAYVLLLLPGTLLHEISHAVAAMVVGVRVHRFSIWPRRINRETLRLGQVHTAGADPIRAAWIGAAPTLVGVVFLSYASLRLGLSLADLPDGKWAMRAQSLWLRLAAASQDPVWFVWAYAALAVANTFLPSAQDRSRWLAAGAILVGLVALTWLLGAGPLVVAQASSAGRTVLGSLTGVLAFAATLDLAAVLAMWPVRLLFEWVSPQARG
jgi:hypothetical protein